MATATPRSIDADPLRAAHRGPVVTAADDGWDMARAAWNLAVDQRPELVARAECTEDVAAAVRFAREHALRVRVQGTGHGACGDLSGALLIDTSAMRGVEIDAGRRVARVEAGALWSDVADPAFEATMAEVFDDCRSPVVEFANPLTGRTSSCTIHIGRSRP